MGDRPNEPSSIFERNPDATNRLKGNAEDLSALFGDVGPADPSATHLGRRDTPSEGDVADVLARLTKKVSGIESDLEDAVSRIVTVDRHLAATYQALQAVLQRQGRPGDTAAAAERMADQLRGVGDRLAERIELLRADALSSQAPVVARIEGLGDRIAALEVEVTRERPKGGVPQEVAGRLSALEVALATTADRLGALESRIAATLSHAEFGREALGELQRTVAPQAQTLAELQQGVGELRARAAKAESAASQAPEALARVDDLLRQAFARLDELLAGQAEARRAELDAFRRELLEAMPQPPDLDAVRSEIAAVRDAVATPATVMPSPAAEPEPEPAGSESSPGTSPFRPSPEPPASEPERRPRPPMLTTRPEPPPAPPKPPQASPEEPRTPAGESEGRPYEQPRLAERGATDDRAAAPAPAPSFWRSREEPQA